MPNRLAQETSPYLLQHQHNPVDWYPWGDEALRKAADEDKPIFLSIGYSACHWCHVMEHESFEDPAIAALLNQQFVSIKVDREERPDLDQIYMHAVQLLTGRGGWPMSVFLTPDLEPFYGGTYFPPRARHGMPGFDQVLTAVERAWREQRAQITDQARRLTEHLQDLGQAAEPSGRTLDPQLLYVAVARLEQSFDGTHGGFGQAPKFPHPMDLQVLLRAWYRQPRDGLLEMVRLTLDKMLQGGIYDHLAGGFARYSVDQRWLVPHFEKMLYDNALLAAVYLDGFRVTGQPRYARVVTETLDYVLRYMTDPEGGFHSTEDADSEGEEGKFYVWTPDEIRQVLGDELGERFCYVYDVSTNGNFEGQSILNLPKTLAQCAALRHWDLEQLEREMADARQRLLAVRDRRVRPGKDDKILVSWNGLMIDALAQAAGVLDQPRYLEAARRAARFLLTQVRRPDGRLLHCWRLGQARLDAYLDDYACLINALITLYEADLDESWLTAAAELTDQVLRHFADPDGAGFFFTADDHQRLITRTKDLQDSSVPSSNGMLATALQRLGALAGRQDLTAAARATLELATGLMEKHPQAAGQLLIAADMALGPLLEIAVVGDPGQAATREVLRDLHRRYLPNRVLACRPPTASAGAQATQPAPSVEAATAPAAGANRLLDPLFAGKPAGPVEPAVYICRDFQCDAPVYGPAAARARWEELSR
ncbi:MAG: thioredoxin domain-containing protein [Pirellulaceae bacterium]|nr:thioredoxin domain-containing protein [Pirellulaceae bacterium]